MKISSSHTKLRTNEVLGKTTHIPELGESFFIFSDSLTEGADFRQVTTSPITEVDFDAQSKTFTFSTKNSKYTLEILSDLTVVEIFSYRRAGSVVN